jgi:hypothetical protein
MAGVPAPQHFVHLPLECRRSVAESKWHHSVLKEPLVSGESRLRNIAVRYANLVVSRLKIQTAKDRRPMQFIEEVINSG